jgi:hypothetical protein
MTFHPSAVQAVPLSSVPGPLYRSGGEELIAADRHLPSVRVALSARRRSLALLTLLSIGHEDFVSFSVC